MEYRSVTELKRLLAEGYTIEKIQPPIIASDIEVSVVTVTVMCPDGKTQAVRAFREEAQAVREYVRNLQ